MSSSIPFKLGESGEVFMRGIPESIASINKQPAGVNFYRLDWEGRTPSDYGVMRFEHGEHSFTLDNVMGFGGAEASVEPQGMNEIDLDFTVTRENAITHAIARDGIYAFMKKLQAAGWRKFIRASFPRLKGTHTLGYRFNYESTYPLDPNYVPVMKQWIDGAGEYPLKKHETSIWRFWANGVYMTIGFSRGHPKFGQSGMPAEHEPAAYLFSMNLQSEASYMRTASNAKYDPNTKIMEDWRLLWPARYQELQKQRAEIEAKMRAAQKPGKMWDWDTDYKDPPILALAQK